jgi:hypothetical protein
MFNIPSGVHFHIRRYDHRPGHGAEDIFPWANILRFPVGPVRPGIPTTCTPGGPIRSDDPYKDNA